jgi:hypothetical protein
LHGVSCVAEWQLIQEAPDLFTMCVVPAKGYSSIDGEQILRNLWHDLAGVEINVRTVPAIGRGAGIKRAFLSPWESLTAYLFVRAIDQG